MEQITYKPIHDGIAVRLANKQVGIIRQVAGGWTYYAKNSKTHGDIFATIQQVKYSIKSKSSRTKKAEPPPTCDVNRRFAAARGSAAEPPNAWIHLTFARTLATTGRFAYGALNTATSGSTSPLFTFIEAIIF